MEHACIIDLFAFAFAFAFAPARSHGISSQLSRDLIERWDHNEETYMVLYSMLVFTVFDNRYRARGMIRGLHRKYWMETSTSLLM